MKSDIVKRLNINEIQKGLIFKDKKILKTILSLYASNNQFQYKVYKSCRKELELVSMDSKCSSR